MVAPETNFSYKETDVPDMGCILAKDNNYSGSWDMFELVVQ